MKPDKDSKECEPGKETRQLMSAIVSTGRRGLLGNIIFFSCFISLSLFLFYLTILPFEHELFDFENFAANPEDLRDAVFYLIFMWGPCIIFSWSIVAGLFRLFRAKSPDDPDA